MKVCVAFIAVCNGPITSDYCARFVTTWHEYPPEFPTDLCIICNGGPLTIEQSLIFAEFDARMFVRSNDGWDIGGQIEAARGPCADYDAVLWAGESIYFHRAGWLARLVQAWERHGPGMYGPYSSNAVRAHLNTTAYFCSPTLLKQYPSRVSSRKDRYEYEHGMNSLWRRTATRGMPVRLVTWDGEWEPRLWRMPPNILWRGDQSNCLMFCNHSDGYHNAPANIRAQWARASDSPYR